MQAALEAIEVLMRQDTKEAVAVAVAAQGPVGQELLEVLEEQGTTAEAGL